MEDQLDDQLEQEAIGRELYAQGYSFRYCKNNDQEWGWLLARQEETWA